jgi:hypothetical protein
VRASGGTRTPVPLIRNQVPYPLGHGRMAVTTGFGPATPGSTIRCSDQAELRHQGCRGRTRTSIAGLTVQRPAVGRHDISGQESRFVAGVGVEPTCLGL